MKNNRIITYLFALYCFLMPFEETLASSFGSILRLVGLVLIAYIILYNRGNWFISKYQIPLILWTIYMFISIIWVESTQWWKYFFRIYIVQIILLCAMEMVPIEAINIKVIQKALITGGCVASGILILFPTISGFTEEGRRTITLLGSTLDPNVVASIILLGTQISLGEYYQSKRIFSIFILLAIWQTLGVFLTGSRGALIALVIVLVIEIFLKFFYGKERKKAFQILFITLICTIFIINVVPQSLMETRFSKDNILGLNELQSGSHNRYTIWMYAWILIKNNPIVGYGCGNFFSAIAEVYRTCASHNLYILLIVEGGVIGILLFGRYIWKLLKDLFVQQNFTTFSLLLTVLFMAFSLDSITYKYFWVALIYSRFIIRNNEREKLELYE